MCRRGLSRRPVTISSGKTQQVMAARQRAEPPLAVLEVLRESDVKAGHKYLAEVARYAALLEVLFEEEAEKREVLPQTAPPTLDPRVAAKASSSARPTVAQPGS
jgi:hypothetical protein